MHLYVMDSYTSVFSMTSLDLPLNLMTFSMLKTVLSMDTNIYWSANQLNNCYWLELLGVERKSLNNLRDLQVDPATNTVNAVMYLYFYHSNLEIL